ncbi:MAG: hypothetical protein FWC26_13365 [Fibromonadales bacterium]|nr:hypothetical protein [Fibromonadales bacterium]
MNRAKYILAAAISIAFALIFSCSQEGVDGANGIDGKNGADGTSCLIEATTGEELASGDFKVICGGVVVGYLNNGATGADGKDGVDGKDGTDGADGADGVDGKDGSDGEPGEQGPKGDTGDKGDDGKDGVDGESCSLEQPDALAPLDAAFAVFCGTEFKGYIYNGAQGASCSAVQKTGFGVMIQCGNDDWVDLYNGINGASCSATQEGFGVMIQCGNDDRVDLYNGASCSAVQEEGYGVRIQCGSSSVYIREGDISCSAVDVDTHIEIRCGSSAPVIIAKIELCNATLYDRATHFCYNNALYSCNNKPYNPSTQFCSSNAIYSKCNGADYNPSTQFCSSNAIYNKCDGADYNPSTHFCYNDELYSCGNKAYNPSTQFCSGDGIYNKCAGTKDYNPATQYCSNGAVTIYGSLEDDGGNVYKTVVIGTQTWMAENLNYNATGSKCNANADSNCVKYGRLYNWATAMNIDAFYNSSLYTASAKHRGICPDGWHLPSDAEWDALITAVGGISTAGTKLKATSSWNTGSGIAGTDNYGFSALPGGGGNSDGSFYGAGNNGYWWSASEYNASYANYRNMYYSSSNVFWYSTDKTDLRSLRCSQD